MIERTMSVEEAVMKDNRVLNKLLKLGIDYDLSAMENIEVVLKERNIDFDSFINELNGTSFEAIEAIRNMSKGEIIDYIIKDIHPNELELVEVIDGKFRKLIKKYYREYGEKLFVIYEVLLLIKAELVSHFSSEEEFEFKEFKDKDNVNFENLLAEHEKTIGLFDRIKYLTNDYNIRADYDEIKDLNNDLEKLDKDMRRHIFIENEILFKR